MATNKLRKFRTIDEVMVFLSGGINGSKLARQVTHNVGLYGLVGTTLTFTKPAAATVTFVTSNGAGGSATPPGTNPDPYILMFQDIKHQIESAVAGTHVTMADGYLVIQETSPSSGVTLKAGSAGGYATVVGTVDLNGLTYGAGGTLDGKTLSLKHNGGGALATTFVAPANRAAVISQINANTVAGGITASINGANELVLTSSDAGATASINVFSGTSLALLGLPVATTVVTGAATNTANQLLGFDTSTDTVGTFYTPVEVVNAPPCWTWANTDASNMVVIFTWE